MVVVGRHSHVPQASATCQLSGILPRRLRALAERMEDRHQRIEKHGDALHPQAYPESSSSCAVRGTNHTARYLGVTLDKRLTWSSHVDQVRKKAGQRLEMLGTSTQERSSAPQAAQPSLD